MRRWLEVITSLCLALHLIYLWLSYPSLPDTVPTHFSAAGRADAFGSKDSIWVLWFVSLGLYLMLSVLSFIPLRSPLWNLPMSIKQDTSGRGRQLVDEMIAWFKLLTVGIFFSLSWLSVHTARGSSAEWVTPVLLVASLFLPLAILAVYIYKMSRREVLQL